MSDPLEDVQDAVLSKIHAGEDVDRDAVLASHPEHADALREFFRVLDVIETPPPPADAATPTSLGEFRIIRELGKGGMGVVYEAEQASLKRRVALKVLPPALRTDPRLVARFQREAEAAAKLRHPGIVPVYSVGEAAGAPFFAMEMVEGRSLDAVLRDLRDGKDGGAPPAGAARRAWAVDVAARVADALDYAHGRGILHRDVKPGNILVDADGAPRLTDFGLALDAAAPGLTMAGEVFGSLHYMSPEQAVRRGSPIDARTDVYSLAVTLYELLTLRLPYDGDSSAQLITALTTGKLVAIRDVDPSVPPALADVVMRAMSREPARALDRRRGERRVVPAREGRIGRRIAGGFLRRRGVHGPAVDLHRPPAREDPRRRRVEGLGQDPASRDVSRRPASDGLAGRGQGAARRRDGVHVDGRGADLPDLRRSAARLPGRRRGPGVRRRDAQRARALRREVHGRRSPERRRALPRSLHRLG
jgi:tRNA A-37 threonylcarbamoyl transferase component Bud32